METKLIRKIRYMFRHDKGVWKLYDDAHKNDKAIFTELEEFLKSYEKCLTQLQKMKKKGNRSDIGNTGILKELKQHSSTDKNLIEQVTQLIEKLLVIHGGLTDGIGTMARLKYGCARAWRRCLRLATYVVFNGAVAAQIACTVVTAVLVAPLVALAIAALIIPTLAGQYWTLSSISPVENPKNVALIMQTETVNHRMELQDTKRRMDKVLKDIKSLVDIIEKEEDLTTNAIKSALENLNDLNKIAGNCKSMKSRDEVSKKLRRASATYDDEEQMKE